MARPLKILAVQMSRGTNPEAKVFAGLVASCCRTDDGESSARLQVLLLQGTDERYDSERISHDIALFESIPDVTIVPIKMGAMGRSGISARHKVVSIAALIAQLPRIFATAARFRPAVIYSSQQYWDILIASMIAKVLRLPRATHIHYNPGPWVGRQVIRLILKSDSILCISKFIEGSVNQLGSRKGELDVVPNPLLHDMVLSPEQAAAARAMLRSELGLNADAQIIGMVGALSPQKGQKALVEAFVRVHAIYNNSHVVLAGGEVYPTKPYKGILQRIISDHHLEESVHLLGYREDVPELLAGFDVFAHPAELEAFGLSVLEASCAGLPVVAWENGGISEIVDNGKTGLLAPLGNIDELAKNLEFLIANPIDAQEMGKFGRQRAITHFNLKVAGEQFFHSLAKLRKR